LASPLAAGGELSSIRKNYHIHHRKVQETDRVIAKQVVPAVSFGRTAFIRVRAKLNDALPP